MGTKVRSKHITVAIVIIASVLAGCSRQEPVAVIKTTVPAVMVPVPKRAAVTVSPIVRAARSQIGVTVAYDSGYVGLSYPGGDLDRAKGVCTDVIIRALRDAIGMDLQRLVHEDMKKSFAVYPKIWGLRKPDRNIDHRRVPNLMTYLKRRGCSVAVTRNAEDYLPGDLVACTVGRNLPHIMIVSDRTVRGGGAMVIHNIGAGTQEEDLLFAFPLTGHYRIKANAEVREGASASSETTPRQGGTTARSIHVIVALCDNQNQGIVPVPAALGDGEDPRNNLYWGAMYGVKSFLKRSDAWTYLGQKNVAGAHIVQRIIFKHATENVYLLADAYRGTSMKPAITDLLRAAGGNDGSLLRIDNGDTVGINGSASLVVYIGHNGLMDVEVARQTRATSGKAVPAIVLACKSKPYFASRLRNLGSSPVLLTTGLMAPEAYTLEAAVGAWISGASAATIRERAAEAYHRYQKCGMNGARRLFDSDTT